MPRAPAAGHNAGVSTLGTSSRTPATRSSAPGWRDPRLWVGVALVAGCVVAGARVVGGADDTTQVWALGTDLAPGEEVAPEDLVARRVRFAEPAALERYLPVEEPLPAALALDRAVAAGELLPRAALGDAAAADVVEVPLAVPPGQVPPSVDRGDVVDVWVAASAEEPGAPARLVLDDVAVVDAPPLAESFGATGERQLVLAVDQQQADVLPRALGAAAAGAVTITRQG